MAFIELPERRNKKEKHYYDSDTNKFQAVLTIHDQHYHDGNSWQDVDENFVADSGGFDRRCDRTRHTIRVTNGGNRRWYPRRNVATEYVDVTNIQYWRTNQWRNINLPAPFWTNNKSEWDTADLYMSITNTWRRIKTQFILKNSNAYTQLRFAVTFVGLTYNQTTGELTSTTDGLVWGKIDIPTAFDANNVSVPVTQIYDGSYIEWSVNTTGAIFPIDVDPTFTDGEGGNENTAYDTFLFGGATDNNNGSSINLMLGVNSITPLDYTAHNSLLKFTLTSLVGKTITSATLSIFCATAAWYEGTATFNRILAANSSWTELGATWNHCVHDTVHWAGDAAQDGGPDAGCSVSGTDYSSTTLGSYSISAGNKAVGEEFPVPFDTTEFVNVINNNYGVRGYDPLDSMDFMCSSDYATAGYRPKLVVVYEESNVPTITATAIVTRPVVVVDWCEP